MKYLLSILMIVISTQAVTHTVSNDSQLSTALAAIQTNDSLVLRAGNFSTPIILDGVNNIVISSAPGERAVLDGTELIESTWERYKNSIYKTKVAHPIWQLFVDNHQMVSARWPNASYRDNSVFNQANNWSKTQAGYNGSLTDTALPSLDLTGAMAVLNCNSFRSYAAKVTGNSGASLTYEQVPTYKDKPYYYFIDAHLNLLDTTDEWFYDPVDSMLYIWGDPTEKEVRGRVRSAMIILNNCRDITIKNLDFFAARLTASLAPRLIIDHNRFSFPATNKRMLKESGSPEVIELLKSGSVAIQFSNNIVEYTDGEGLYLEGDDAVVENNYMHTLDYTATSQRGLANTFWLKGKRLLFTQNTIHTTGSSEMLVPGSEAEMSYNDISYTGYVQNDGAVFQLTRNVVDKSETHHNWIHDTPKYGFRFDAPAGEPSLAGTNGSVHHNVIWNCGKGMMIKGDNHKIYNNTVWGSPLGNDIIILDEMNSNSNSQIFNNLSDKISGHRAKSSLEYPIPGSVTTNYNGYEQSSSVVELIPEWERYVFHSDSDAINEAGTVVEGLPQNFSGTAPSIGAYAAGENWTAGTTLDTVALSPWPWNLNGSSDSTSIITPKPQFQYGKEVNQWGLYDLRGRLIMQSTSQSIIRNSVKAKGIYIMRAMNHSEMNCLYRVSR